MLSLVDIDTVTHTFGVSFSLVCKRKKTTFGVTSPLEDVGKLREGRHHHPAVLGRTAVVDDQNLAYPRAIDVPSHLASRQRPEQGLRENAHDVQQGREAAHQVAGVSASCFFPYENRGIWSSAGHPLITSIENGN